MDDGVALAVLLWDLNILMFILFILVWEIWHVSAQRVELLWLG